MILGNINFLEHLPYLPNKIRDAIEYVKLNLNQKDFTGKITLDNEECFIIVAESMTEPYMQRRAEYHHTYLDVQILLMGFECMGYSSHYKESILEDQLITHDVAFVGDVINEQFFQLTPGDFAVFYPGEIHRPLCLIQKPTKIKKAIIKIKVN